MFNKLLDLFSDHIQNSEEHTSDDIWFKKFPERLPGDYYRQQPVAEHVGSGKPSDLSEYLYIDILESKLEEEEVKLLSLEGMHIVGGRALDIFARGVLNSRISYGDTDVVYISRCHKVFECVQLVTNCLGNREGLSLDANTDAYRNLLKDGERKLKSFERGDLVILGGSSALSGSKELYEFISSFDIDICKIIIYKAGKRYRAVFHKNVLKDLREQKVKSLGRTNIRSVTDTRIEKYNQRLKDMR